MSEMVSVTRLEQLSNEIFCEIFNYLNAFDLFFAFTSLNSRISSILKLMRLHVLLHSTYCRRQVEFLSDNLTFHSDQVFSLDINDQICDQTNVVGYLFSRHSFLNLRSCTLWMLHSTPKLINVIEQLKNQTQLVSIHIIQSYDAERDKLCQSHAHQFSQMVLVNTPATLCSATLLFHYDHSELMRSVISSTQLTYLELMFYGELENLSIHSLIPVLRIHVRLRHLVVIIENSIVSTDNIYIK